MTSQLVSDDAVAVLLDKDEVSDPDLARSLVLSLLSSEGLTPWDDMEIELFSSGERVLLMARRSILHREGYRFVDSDALIGAVLTCRRDLPSSLISYGGAYYLLISRPDDEQLAELREFSLDEEPSADFLAHIGEHGKLLIKRGAIAQLKKFFV